jgi:hypothetical protein
MGVAATDKPVRAEGLEVNEVADGLVVYQDGPERVHYLNNTAALVFELCTGTNSVEGITDLLRAAFGLDAPPAAEVASCIEQLRSQEVLR